MEIFYSDTESEDDEDSGKILNNVIKVSTIFQIFFIKMPATCVSPLIIKTLIEKEITPQNNLPILFNQIFLGNFFLSENFF